MQRSLRILSALLAVLAVTTVIAQTPPRPVPSHTAAIKTYVNPFNVPYPRYSGADPALVQYKSEYYIFASGSDGYFYSPDLVSWTHIIPDLPQVGRATAPATLVYNGALYYLGSSFSGPSVVYRSTDVKNGKWEVYNPKLMFFGWDPGLFADDDGRVFLYWGCTDIEPLRGVELDPDNLLNPKGPVVVMAHNNPPEQGWARIGDWNQLEFPLSFNEGSWMNKHDGKYYFQWAVPGTEYRSYADTVAVCTGPLGPCTPAEHNPMSFKPTGWIGGAGHGSTDQDVYGNYWHASSMKLSLRARLDRRLVLLPAFFDKDGVMYTFNGLADYPMIVPDKKVSSPDELFPGWMLLSYRKPAHASTWLEPFPPELAFDENGATYWAAYSDRKGEWLSIDLEKEYTIRSIQISFIEHTSQSVFGDTGLPNTNGGRFPTGGPLDADGKPTIEQVVGPVGPAGLVWKPGEQDPGWMADPDYQAPRPRPAFFGESASHRAPAPGTSATGTPVSAAPAAGTSAPGAPGAPGARTAGAAGFGGPEYSGPPESEMYYQYLAEYSNDNRTWKPLIDKRLNKTNVPYDYVQLDSPVKARFIRLTNYHVPKVTGGKFAVAGFRIFGTGTYPKPAKVTDFNVVRDPNDRRNAAVTWTSVFGAIGYNIRLGTKPNKLYTNYAVYSDTSLTIRSLEKTPGYYFEIDSFNENGVSKGEVVKHIE